jgi:formylglycine-generating enzyme required for sulfatase activity
MRLPLLVSILVLAPAAACAQRGGFVRVPVGSFLFGCSPELPCAETFPKRRIEFDRPFWMGKTEVTVNEFRSFVKATGYRTDAEKAGEARTWKSPGFRVSGHRPVIYMTLNDAAAYCGWIGARVPTEAEWEYAARAGTTTYHYWGEEIDGRYLWYFENSNGRPQPVGRKLPNAWGLYDVEGNAFEWVTASPPHSSVTKEGFGSIRGGSWITCPEPYPPTKEGRRYRHIGLSIPLDIFKGGDFPAGFRRYDTGFRCARSEP